MSVINLSKNQTINLSKTGKGLSQVLMGVNWGMIEKTSSGLFGFGKKVVNKEAVDLDASITMFGNNGQELDTVSYKKLRNSFVFHSGDDLVGDSSADDSDNETITVNLASAPSNVTTMFLYVNSFSGQQFNKIPYAGVRLYEGSVNRPTNTLAKLDIANDSSFKGSRTMVLGKIYKEEGIWQFKAIGDNVLDITGISGTVTYIRNNYL